MLTSIIRPLIPQLMSYHSLFVLIYSIMKRSLMYYSSVIPHKIYASGAASGRGSAYFTGGDASTQQLLKRGVFAQTEGQYVSMAIEEQMM
uniref:Uncharacterized protein n=1 Tax=Meloidogyne hapla TaxID=6305 RepID=A0A1I8B1Y5_MELHA